MSAPKDRAYGVNPPALHAVAVDTISAGTGVPRTTAGTLTGRSMKHRPCPRSTTEMPSPIETATSGDIGGRSIEGTPPREILKKTLEEVLGMMLKEAFGGVHGPPST